MAYEPIFDHNRKKDEARSGNAAQDARDGRGYRYDEEEEIPIRVNVALATGRPLLVRGNPGTGKSSLAASVAHQMDWNYFEFVVTSRTQARDLQWHFDMLERLNDAEAGHPMMPQARNQVSRVTEKERYVEPGVLWWAFDPDSAPIRGAKRPIEDLAPAKPPTRDPFAYDPNARTVILIDEIDKADPDVPNDLLVPLGSLQFHVEDTDFPVKLNREKVPPPLIIITSNNERELPPAFLRRCVTLFLEPPTPQRLEEIAISHHGDDAENVKIYEALLEAMKAPPEGASAEVSPSTAEYLDAIGACLDLHVKPKEDDEVWKKIIRTTLWKRQGTAKKS